MAVPPFIPSHKSLRLILLTLVLWSSVQVKTSVCGRSFGVQQASSSVAGRQLSKIQDIEKITVEEKLMVRALIGSRPPRCEAKCITCGHCEPVQVPAVPEAISTNSGGSEYASNYKPISWKCKCGDTIFNP